MKVWQIQSSGIDQLVLADLPTLRPGRGQILVKVHAVSLNYRDLLMVRGHYNPKMALPRIPCSDGAGAKSGFRAFMSARSLISKQ